MIDRPDRQSTNEAYLAAALAEAWDIDPLPPLVVLCRQLGLSRFEQETLLLFVAMAFPPNWPPSSI